MSVHEIENPIYHDIQYRNPVRIVRTLTEFTLHGSHYSRVGDHMSHGVFMESWRWPEVPSTDDGLFVFENERQMVPLAEWKVRSSQPRRAAVSERR